MRRSVAMTGKTASELSGHLLRADGDEDLCFATWHPSTGRDRLTALLNQPLLPRLGERHVHGNASFEAAYALRAAQEAALGGTGLAFMHSHPRGRGWQALNEIDQIAESRIANLAREITGLPLVGLTKAGDRSWSARIWGGIGRHVAPNACESVRVLGDSYSVTFNDALVPRPDTSGAQVRTVHTWGEEIQATMARLRVAIAGVGSVGMTVAELLGRTGIEHLGVFDFDTVEMVNLDRLRGASLLDAILKRSKTHVARRLLEDGSTATRPQHEFHEISICEPEGLRRLLDFDVIVSCVDRPWPRHVLNTISYADLIPVIEGGLRTFQNKDGSFRNAYWRSTVVRPGRPCLACLGQYNPGIVQVERDGSLDDPSYIATLPGDSPILRRENVAGLSVSVTAALLQQFMSYIAHPSGFGDPGPLLFNLRDQARVERVASVCVDGCAYQGSTGTGDGRLDPSSTHAAAERARCDRAKVSSRLQVARGLDNLLHGLRQHLTRFSKSMA
jgi:molybdopterin-synthase adenylyltransferase